MGRLHDLYAEFGQSPWIDDIRRTWLTDGTLDRLVDRGVRGLTSNPTIFDKAVRETTAYDDAIVELRSKNLGPEEIVWELMYEDVASAAERLSPVFEESAGTDGFVSIELDPRLAYDEEATVEEAKKLWERLSLPNLLVKVPGTEPGVRAVRRLVADGVNVNVTLLFSVDRYREVALAYLEGLEQREGDLSSAAGVASFFVSRVDTACDGLLDECGHPRAEELKGQAAIANARAAYRVFRELSASERWKRLAQRGARPQRPLWASTSTKNPAYSPTKYVDELIGPDSVNTMPLATLEEFERNGRLTRSVDADPEGDERVLAGLTEVGIDLESVASDLEKAGVQAFVESFEALVSSMTEKAGALT